MRRDRLDQENVLFISRIDSQASGAVDGDIALPEFPGYSGKIVPAVLLIIPYPSTVFPVDNTELTLAHRSRAISLFDKSTMCLDLPGSGLPPTSCPRATHRIVLQKCREPSNFGGTGSFELSGCVGAAGSSAEGGFNGCRIRCARQDSNIADAACSVGGPAGLPAKTSVKTELTGGNSHPNTTSSLAAHLGLSPQALVLR